MNRVKILILLAIVPCALLADPLEDRIRALTEEVNEFNRRNSSSSQTIFDSFQLIAADLMHLETEGPERALEELKSACERYFLKLNRNDKLPIAYVLAQLGVTGETLEEPMLTRLRAIVPGDDYKFRFFRELKSITDSGYQTLTELLERKSQSTNVTTKNSTIDMLEIFAFRVKHDPEVRKKLENSGLLRRIVSCLESEIELGTNKPHRTGASFTVWQRKLDRLNAVAETLRDTSEDPPTIPVPIDPLEVLEQATTVSERSQRLIEWAESRPNRADLNPAAVRRLIRLQAAGLSSEADTKLKELLNLTLLAKVVRATIPDSNLSPEVRRLACLAFILESEKVEQE